MHSNNSNSVKNGEINYKLPKIMAAGAAVKNKN